MVRIAGGWRIEPKFALVCLSLVKLRAHVCCLSGWGLNSSLVEFGRVWSSLVEPELHLGRQRVVASDSPVRFRLGSVALELGGAAAAALPGNIGRYWAGLRLRLRLRLRFWAERVVRMVLPMGWAPCVSDRIMEVFGYQW